MEKNTTFIIKHMDFLGPQKTLSQTQDIHTNSYKNDEISVCYSFGEVLEVISEPIENAPHLTYVRFILGNQWNGDAQIETVVGNDIDRGLHRVPVVGEILHTFNRDETLYREHDFHTGRDLSEYKDSVLMLQRVHGNDIQNFATQGMHSCHTYIPRKYQTHGGLTMPVLELFSLVGFGILTSILFLIWIVLLIIRIILQYRQNNIQK